RTLRHEVGDLLQAVYSTVAILQDRLAAGSDLERRLLGDLKARAEGCRQELDAIVDLVCPLTLSLTPVDLGQLASVPIPAPAGPSSGSAWRWRGASPSCTAAGSPPRTAPRGAAPSASSCPWPAPRGRGLTDRDGRGRLGPPFFAKPVFLPLFPLALAPAAGN